MLHERIRIKWKDYLAIARTLDQVQLTKQYWRLQAKEALDAYFDEIEKHVIEGGIIVVGGKWLLKTKD